MNAQPFFLPAGEAGPGQRFCLHHAASPAVAARGAIVYIHPFAEEMNKSRRMAALQAHAFAGAGFHVLHIDLYGCGDSSGDFADARWELWREDVVLAAHWLRGRFPGPLTLWGLRLGALLALDCAHRLRPDGLLLWQAVVSGQAHLHQFARLQTAARMFGGDTVTGADSHEIAGYTIAPALADAIRRQDAPPLPPACPVQWLELTPASSEQPPALQAASMLVIDRWRQAGASVTAKALCGTPFWTSSEIIEVPALLDASLDAMTSLASTGVPP